jgi:hypothetical protein
MVSGISVSNAGKRRADNSERWYSRYGEGMKESGASPGGQGLLSIINLLLISLLPNKRAGIFPVTRYTCRACHYNCELLVRGKIIRIRQVCPQFMHMDHHSLWIEQDVS